MLQHGSINCKSGILEVITMPLGVWIQSPKLLSTRDLI
jgi:hypothetical protein